MENLKQKQVSDNILSGFLDISETELTNLPPSIAKALVPVLEGQNVIRREVLRKQGEKNNRTYIGFSESDHHLCNGVVIDSEEAKLLGWTSFGGSHDPSTDPELRYLSVSYSQTNSDFQGQGLGKQRLVIANQYCKERFGLPLLSDAAQTDEAKRVWQQLIDDGTAREVLMPNGATRYSFI